MDTHHWFTSTEDVFDGPAIGVGHAHKESWGERKYDGINVIRRHARILKRPGSSNLRLFNESMLWLVCFEFRLESAEDVNIFLHRAPPAASNTIMTFPCCA